MRPIHACFLPLLLVLALPGPIAAGQQVAPLSEVIDVRITNVEFVVSDARGNFAEGLTREDFEVYENGKQQEITNFYAVSGAQQGQPIAGTVSIPGAQTPQPKTARRLIFYFDNASLDYANRKAITQGARDFAQTSVRPGDQILVATWNGSLQIPFGWSDDLGGFNAAIDAIAKTTAGASARETQRKSIMTQLDSFVTDEVIGSTGRSQIDGPTFEMLMNVGRRYAEEVRGDVSRQSEALGRLLGSLAGVEGRKALILAAEGLAAQPGADVFQQLENVRQKMGASAGSKIGQTGRAYSPLTEMQKYDTGPMLRGVGRIANAAGVTIYGLNPRGLGTWVKDSGTTERHGMQEMNVDFAESTEGFYGLAALSAETGGLAIVGAPADVAFARISTDLGSYYSIGYRARAGESPERTIEVRAKKSGLRVRSRKSFVYRTVSEEMADRVVSNQLQPTFLNDLAVSVVVDPAKVDGSKRVVPLKILVPVEKLTLIPDGENVTGGFLVYLCTGDGKGGASGVNMQAHQIRWPREAVPYLRSKNVTYALEVPIEGTRNQISIGVIDQVSQSTGFAVARAPG